VKITIFWENDDVDSGRNLPKFRRNLLPPSLWVEERETERYEAICYSETSVNLYQTTLRHIPECTYYSS
jgi:hypothetical protein